MGGKTWQQDEEELFWLELIPQSPEGLDPSSRKLSWKQMAEAMHRRLGSEGYRNYNHQLIYEHFYQNCKSNHPSPRAKAFVTEYMQRRGDKPIERPKEDKSAKRRTGSDGTDSLNPKLARQLVEVTPGAEGELDAPGNGSLYLSTSGDDPSAASGLSEAARPAIRAQETDRASMARHWASGRVPLSSAPLSVATGAYQHNITSSPPESNSPHMGHASSSSESTILRPASLPSITFDPRFGSERVIDMRADGIHSPLPSIHSLVPNTNAFRPARLITPKDHGPMFETLLSAASTVNSSEPSPDSISSRGGTSTDPFDPSVPSPATTVDEDNGAPATVQCVWGKGKLPAYSEMETICE